MSKWKNSLFFKVGIIVIIMLLLLIPKSMIESLIREREYTQSEAIHDVSSKWADKQQISGPFVTIPFYRYVKQRSKKDSTLKIVQVKDYIHLLPENLDIQAELIPEKRYRGIYEVVVYNTKLKFKGNFENHQLKEFDIKKKDILFNKASLSIGIDDLRGIETQLRLKWNDSTSSFNPGTVNQDIISSGINAPVQLSSNDSASYSFTFDLNLKGSQGLYFVPVGKTTNIHMESPWPTPSFNGAFLPDERKIGDESFTADWNILHLNRNFPQQWIGDSYRINNSAFGVDLFLPVDNYQKSTRSIKYAILFIALSFMVFFFVEVLKGQYIHPIQYILVGLALIIFFTLLVSISEHMNFNAAYAISAIATLVMIASYVKAILKSIPLALLISGILSILYTFIFVILQLEDYALLIGSVGLFIILGLVMYISRKIDWYDIQLGKNGSTSSPTNH